MAERHDVAADPTARRADDRLVRIGDNDRFTAAKPDARMPIPGDLHRPILTQPAAPRPTCKVGEDRSLNRRSLTWRENRSGERRRRRRASEGRYGVPRIGGLAAAM